MTIVQFMDKKVRRALAPLGECKYCDEKRPTYTASTFMPPHDASENCQSGKHTHCTCDICF